MRNAAAFWRRQFGRIFYRKGFSIERGACRAFIIGGAHDLNFVHAFFDHFLQPFLVLLQEMTLNQVPGRSVSGHPGGPRSSVGFSFHRRFVRHVAAEKVLPNIVTSL